MSRKILYLTILTCLAACSTRPAPPVNKRLMANADRIQPYVKNPFYWQYKGAPVLLLGGSVEDNLFQIADIEDQLDLLHSLGGNYVRCTMSSRDEGDAWPFERAPETGLYDLEQPGQDYWTRFEHFLNLCAERDIILQIEVWDRFDFARGPWQDNPYNPKNNINYTVEESGLAESIGSHPGQKENAFFHTIPALKNNALVLGYQQAQLIELLKRSRPYPNVLYCIDNETNESPEWGKFWSLQIKDQAGESIVQTTEMWDAWDLQSTQHRHTLDHPELYSFFDLSQNNHRQAEEHWQNPQLIRQYIIDSGHIRPMNSVKIYGANTGHFGTHRDAQERLWRNIFGGLASSRFHRPDSGLGLSKIAQAHIRSLRDLTDRIDIFTCTPDNDLLDARSANEAYCTANPGIEYAVFFPDGGNVVLDTEAAAGNMIGVQWLDIRKSVWLDEETVEAGKRLRLVTPEEEGYWAVIVKVAE
jgi:hypothetical protein